MEKSRYAVKGISFDVYDSGSRGESEKLIIFTNGIGRSPRDYKFLTMLADYGNVRVKAVELAGRNTVDPLPWNGGDYSKILAEYIISEGFDNGAYTLSGHSAGGLIVSETAQQIGDRGLEKVIALNPALPAGGTLSLDRIKNFASKSLTSPNRIWHTLRSLVTEKSPVLFHQFVAQNPFRSNSVKNYFAGDVTVDMFGEDDPSSLNYEIGIFYGVNDEIIPLSPEVEEDLMNRGARIFRLEGKWHNWPVHNPRFAAELIHQAATRSLSEIDLDI